MAQKRRHPLEKTRRWYPFEAHPQRLSLSLLNVSVLFCCDSALGEQQSLSFFDCFFCPGGLAQWFGLGVLRFPPFSALQLRRCAYVTIHYM